MQPLPLKLRKNGCTYTQVHRHGNVCIYEQEVAENLNYYEVFIVRSKPLREFKGKSVPAMEIIPRNEDFGKTAWSFRTLAEALVRFNQLVNEKQEGKSHCIEHLVIPGGQIELRSFPFNTS